jgi:hypothetical protein
MNWSAVAAWTVLVLVVVLGLANGLARLNRDRFYRKHR